jgi:hypothetical protein
MLANLIIRILNDLPIPKTKFTKPDPLWRSTLQKIAFQKVENKYFPFLMVIFGSVQLFSPGSVTFGLAGSGSYILCEKSNIYSNISM